MITVKTKKGDGDYWENDAYYIEPVIIHLRKQIIGYVEKDLGVYIFRWDSALQIWNNNVNFAFNPPFPYSR